MLTRVLCFGNSWHGDDGFGPAVSEQLLLRELPDNTDVHNIECGSLHLQANAFTCDLLILVDACYNEHTPPGGFGWLTPDEIRKPSSTSPHAGSLEELLMHLPIILGDRPKPTIKLLLASIADTQPFSPHLSKAIKEIVPKASEAICQLILQRQRDCA